MTFDDILEQAIEMLQRRKRISYRALQLQFKLDDEYFDVLKEELIDIQQLAVDQDGRMFVWTGETEVPPVSPAQPVQTLESPPTQRDQPIQAERRPEPHTPDAERRQLTVMFCRFGRFNEFVWRIGPRRFTRNRPRLPVHVYRSHPPLRWVCGPTLR